MQKTNESGYVIAEKTKLIINTNYDELNQYLSHRETEKKRNMMEQTVSSLRKEMDEMKSNIAKLMNTGSANV